MKIHKLVGWVTAKVTHWKVTVPGLNLWSLLCDSVCFVLVVTASSSSESELRWTKMTEHCTGPLLCATTAELSLHLCSCKDRTPEITVQRDTGINFSFSDCKCSLLHDANESPVMCQDDDYLLSWALIGLFCRMASAFFLVEVGSQSCLGNPLLISVSLLIRRAVAFSSPKPNTYIGKKRSGHFLRPTSHGYLADFDLELLLLFGTARVRVLCRLWRSKDGGSCQEASDLTHRCFRILHTSQPPWEYD